MQWEKKAERKNKNNGAKEVMLAHAPHGKKPTREWMKTDKKRKRFKIKATMKIDTILFGFVSHVKRIALNNPLHHTNARTRRKSINTSEKNASFESLSVQKDAKRVHGNSK